jgi:hypothetical protein
MLEPGVIVAGDFRIDDVLGDGGMGVVYQATQVSLDRTVALKLITTALSQDFAFRERFRQEGRVQAKIEHPHIIDVYAAGESEYGLFLAMRLVHGPSLNELVGTPALTVHRTVRLLSQIASALDAAHGVGLVHRDIKPHNILIDQRRDHSYLADFGVTKARGTPGMTQVGQRVGTLTYMAPEQFRGQSATELSDVYSFGAVVYECLVGTVPYPMPTEASLITAHLTEPVPRVSEHCPDLPPTVDTMIAKAMAKDPEERYASASDLMRDIAQGVGVTPAAEATVATTPETALSPGPPNGGETIVVPSRTREEPQPAAEPEPLAPAANATILGAAATPAPETSLAAAEAKPATEVTPAPVAPTELTPEPASDATALTPPPVEDKPTADEPAPPVVTAPAQTAPARVIPPTRAATPPPTRPATPPPTRAATPPTRAATPPTALAAPAAERAAAPAGAARGGRKVLVAIAAVAVVLAAVGFFAGHASAPAKKKTVTTPTHHTVRSGDISLSAPASWQRQATAPTIPGLKLTDAIALGPGARPGSSGSVVGHAAAAWPTYLPAGFRKAVGQHAVAQHELVHLGNLSAFRYAGVRPRGFDGVVTVYTVPQAKSSTIVACYARGASSAPGSCDSVAASLQLANAKPFSLDPSPKYAATLNRSFTTLNSSRRRGLATLARAKTQSQQATAASALAAAYARAARTLRGASASPYVRTAHVGVVSALKQTQAAYSRLAAAARSGNSTAYAAARQQIRARESALKRALALMGRLGYRA